MQTNSLHCTHYNTIQYNTAILQYYNTCCTTAQYNTIKIRSYTIQYYIYYQYKHYTVSSQATGLCISRELRGLLTLRSSWIRNKAKRNIWLLCWRCGECRECRDYDHACCREHPALSKWRITPTPTDVRYTRHSRTYGTPGTAAKHAVDQRQRDTHCHTLHPNVLSRNLPDPPRPQRPCVPPKECAFQCVQNLSFLYGR